jgi:hypothetical protein
MKNWNWFVKKFIIGEEKNLNIRKFWEINFPVLWNDKYFQRYTVLKIKHQNFKFNKAVKFQKSKILVVKDSKYLRCGIVKISQSENLNTYWSAYI